MVGGKSLISSLLGPVEAIVVEDVGEGMQVSVGVWLGQGKYCQFFFLLLKQPFLGILGIYTWNLLPFLWETTKDSKLLQHPGKIHRK